MLTDKKGITPIFVRTPGRSGSTLVMQILASSEHIAFDRHYPFEVRHLSYLMRSAYVLSKPFNAKAHKALPFTWDQSFLFNSNPEFIGPMPTNSSLFEQDAYCEAIQKGLYKAFSDELLERDSSRIYYAEKVTTDDIIEEVKKITTSKVIYGVRDPRDRMVSIMEFNKKRGVLGFGWNQADTPESFALRFATQSRNYLRKINRLKKEGDKNSFILYYESLILQQEQEITRLSEWLDLPLTNAFLERHRKDVLAKHATSLDPVHSIAKWKNELSSGVIDIFEDILGEDILEFNLFI